MLASRLGLTESQVTVLCPDIGGGFGQKIALYREELTVAALSRALGRPVRWREERGENLLASAHAREQTAVVRAAVDADGRITALSLREVEDFGAYCFYPANYLLRMTVLSLTGPYRIADYDCDMRVVLTNKCGSAPMRAPMSIASWVMDGTIEAVARALGLDPIEVRRRNMLGAGELPVDHARRSGAGGRDSARDAGRRAGRVRRAGVPRAAGGRPAARGVSRHGAVLPGGGEYLRLGVLSRRGHSRVGARGGLGEGGAERARWMSRSG